MGRSPVRIAVLGLGEAGGAIASDLISAGAELVGYDPAPGVGDGIPRALAATEAVADADLVLSVNGASAAYAVAESVLPAMTAGAVFADLNTAPPEAKRRIGALADDAGVRFADVALLAPVPGRGAATPSLACGPGADEYARIMTALGGRVEVAAGASGTAAARKLLRSVVMKGLAAAIVEALAGARAAGCEEWLRADLTNQFGAALVERLETGTLQHAARRIDEMSAASELLNELDVPPRIADAARMWLADLAGRK